MICILYQSFQIQPSSLSKARKNQTNTKKGKPSCGVRLLTCKLLNDTVHVNMTQSVSLAGHTLRCLIPNVHRFTLLMVETTAYNNRVEHTTNENDSNRTTRKKFRHHFLFHTIYQ